MPTDGDIAVLETALAPALLGHQIKGGPDFSRAPDGWQRQYVGYVRGGRRFIYGSFLYVGRHPPKRWRTGIGSSGVCDGGPAEFGIEYDVAARRFTHMAFNGPA